MAVRINPVNSTDTLSGVVDLYGSAVNGHDPAQVTTNYRVDVCPGDDFFICDQTPGAWQSAGISGQGGNENTLLGSFDASNLAIGDYTLRLQVISLHDASGRSQILNDYYPVSVQQTGPVDLSGTIKTVEGQDICAMVLASGHYMFSCNPRGVFSLSVLPRESDGTIKRQIYAAGFLPKIDVLTDSVDEEVVMTRSDSCPNYNIPYRTVVNKDAAGQWIDISGAVYWQNTQAPLCAMVLVNGQHTFSCDGRGSYALHIPLDSNGQYTLQVFASGFAPAKQTFDELSTNNVVRLSRAIECQ